MNITQRESDKLFDTSLDVLNNVDEAVRGEQWIHLSIPTDLYDAWVDATCAIIKGNAKRKGV